MARIALVHDVAGVAEAQVRILRSAGHDVDHLRLPDFGPSWPWWAKALTLPVRLLMYVPVIWRLRREPYDVIHIHWISRGIIGLLSGRPFLIQAHGSDLHLNGRLPGLSRLNRWVLERAGTIFYSTPNLAEHLEPFDGKCRYLPNPVADVGEARAPDSVRRAIIFTRLEPVKGVDRVFPAAEELAQDLELTAVAWGPLAPEYTSRYGAHVHFGDPVPHDRVAAFLQQFDLVIGQMEQGALGLSELEAMAAGRPLVCGIDRTMYPGDKPPVVFARDPAQLIEQVEALRDDARRLANLSREGRAWVRRNHGYERHLHLLESAYFGERVTESMKRGYKLPPAPAA